MKIRPPAKKVAKPRKAPAAPPEIDEVASVDDYETGEKFVLRLECYPVAGMTQRDCVERFQKFFDFYHAALGVKIIKE